MPGSGNSETAGKLDASILMLGWGYPPKIDGGLDIHVARLFEALRDCGVDVSLALPADRAPDIDGVIALDVAGEGMFAKAGDMSRRVMDIAKDHDIVHTHDWFGAETGLKAKKYSGAQWVATFHSIAPGRSRNSSPQVENLERAMAERADEIIAVSQKLAEEVLTAYGRKPVTIHNGFSSAASTGKDVREKLGIDGRMVFYVGRHAEQKGIEHLIYGFSKLEGEATLVIGGEGHMREPLEKFVEMLGVGDRVLFTGHIPENELGDYYRAADVFVSPSINEPFGLTVTEALEAGTSVVATSSGVEEILPGDALVTVNPDSDSIKQGIEEAFARDTVKVRSRSWQEVADETVEVYKRLSR